MKLTLVRHCEVDKRYKNCYNGHNDIGLSKNGEFQAKELAQKIDSLEFDAVFCSDLRRAKESLKHSLHVKSAIYSDKLREKSWGEHEGMSYDEIVLREKIAYISFLQWIKILDGEPYLDYIKRVKEFFLDYLPSLKKENILVITHAGVIRVLLSIIHNISLEEAFSIKVEYNSITLLEI
ncbi:Phosphoglycerate/bisphosphoglycerate mutase [Sulfurimonas denitrificans DSM 1251]|jgi:alpha-ribazole phosphatase|uniref:Phosphoglycerate/bisphosphoglycerate mutase n=1 Tax=Sulfurimonas denitrificans (strain ATCC 33889 / DSM 1251) TaxID=326298 RepID=Q30UE0_SULDN|nr:alpha-ribazole phosphatase family protein [Sulfurimonas denitrificans]ABB43391.1 Phosphoglycerate/bisphosphoglycerate mutase [Sulfurimonas denitrificans DSM 1251]MDD3442259.1 alpha-ribazole phosphatase family protein [Sulfurimonas denitrificans]